MLVRQDRKEPSSGHFIAAYYGSILTIYFSANNACVDNHLQTMLEEASGKMPLKSWRTNNISPCYHGKLFSHSTLT